MRDSELTERPGKGWTPWERGPGQVKIEAIWWDARALHFPKLNCSCWFSGSELVGIEHWDIAATNGACASRWTITRPYPSSTSASGSGPGSLDRIRIAAQTRMLAQIQATGKRHSAPDAEAV
ncbi:MAG: hypothetical protein E5V81_35175 [Mesorhizobium sp.]|nr:MAG: hypothetical protein E5V81_35175 [Mesorhizobium sp.]